MLFLVCCERSEVSRASSETTSSAAVAATLEQLLRLFSPQISEGFLAWTQCPAQSS